MMIFWNISWWWFFGMYYDGDLFISWWWSFQHFFIVLEHVLRHGLRPKKVFWAQIMIMMIVTMIKIIVLVMIIMIFNMTTILIAMTMKGVHWLQWALDETNVAPTLTQPWWCRDDNVTTTITMIVMTLMMLLLPMMRMMVVMTFFQGATRAKKRALGSPAKSGKGAIFIFMMISWLFQWAFW